MEEFHWEMVRMPLPIFKEILRTWLTYVRNRGELSEGWYEPSTLQKAVQSAQDQPEPEPESKYEDHKPSVSRPARREPSEERGGGNESESDDEIGPALPGQESKSRAGRMGPSIPNMQDLELKRGRVLILRDVLSANISFRNGSRRWTRAERRYKIRPNGGSQGTKSSTR